jgi:hypothetical protein
VNKGDLMGLDGNNCVCEDTHGHLDWEGEQIAQISAPGDILETAIANIFAQIGATVGDTLVTSEIRAAQPFP